jgi:dienelactone hydrolase
LFLQAQGYVRPDLVGVVGWSEGGGAVLFAIGPQSPGRRAQLPQGDFRVAVAFYPASCNQRRQVAWTSTIPLLVLVGAEDVWIPQRGARNCSTARPAAAPRSRYKSIRAPITISTGLTWRATSRQIIAPHPEALCSMQPRNERSCDNE